MADHGNTAPRSDSGGVEGVEEEGEVETIEVVEVVEANGQATYLRDQLAWYQRQV